MSTPYLRLLDWKVVFFALLGCYVLPGILVGTLLARQLHDYFVIGHHGGWSVYWWIQAGSIAVCIPVLAVFYQGVPAGKAAGS